MDEDDDWKMEGGKEGNKEGVAAAKKEPSWPPSPPYRQVTDVTCWSTTSGVRYIK